MLGPIYLLGFLAVAASSYARVHHLIVGNLALPASLYVLEFDDESLEFRIASNNTAVSSHVWITFGVRLLPPPPTYLYPIENPPSLP